jgi:hypothetical protein
LLGGVASRGEEWRVGIPEAARLGSRTVGTLIVAVRIIDPYDVGALGMIEGAVVVFVRGRRRDLR